MRRRVQVDGSQGTRRRLTAVPTFALTVVAMLAACSGSDATEPPETVVTTTTLAPPQRVDDGVLKIGALIPTSDTTVGPSLTESFSSEIAAINEAGGVLGRNVLTIVADEGATSATAARAIEELVAAGVDAIVGPTSSTAAIGALDTAVSSGVVSCSPTASAISLDDYPDNGLFFRTIATDTLQARAIAEQAEQTGATKIVIVHVDDAYGRPYADAVTTDALTFAQVTTVAVAVGDTDLSDDVAALLDDDPQVAIVLGSGDDTARFLEALSNRDFGGMSKIFVNDAARSNRARLSQLPPRLRELVRSVAPQIVTAADSLGAEPSNDPEDARSAPFDAQVRDCINLISLATMQARSDSPLLIASQMSSVSAGGQVCLSFTECAGFLDASLQINYDGTISTADLGRNGDLDRATFDLFDFAEDGTDRLIPGQSVSVDAV
jgi:branched-chain amino acid transport system substrate-binding protein